MNLLVLFRKMLNMVEDRSDLRFIMYTRPGCHLCDVAWQELTRARERYRFHLEKCDVDADPELLAQYGGQVPVVAVNGQVRFRGAVNPVLLRRLLEAMPFATNRSEPRP